MNWTFFQVCLKVQSDSGSTTRDLELICTVDELQDLLSKLKDAKNNLEKVANFWPRMNLHL